jgi:hypothetical protein
MKKFNYKRELLASKIIGHSKPRKYGALALYIQGDLGGKFNILGGDSSGHCEEKSLYEHVSNSEWLQI